MVEALMVLSLVLENEGDRFFDEIIPVDLIVSDANRLFLEQQVSMHVWVHCRITYGEMGER